MRVSDILKGRKTVKVNVEGLPDAINVTYNPKAYTPEVEERIASGLDDPRRQSRGLKEMAMSLILEWDLTNDDGSAFDLTTENLSILPIEFLGDVLNSIVEDMTPGEARSATSDGGSLVAPIS